MTKTYRYAVCGLDVKHQILNKRHLVQSEHDLQPRRSHLCEYQQVK